MPKKSLKKIKEKLLNHPLSELNGKELVEYYNYRLDNLIMSKKILVQRELEYLLCEVGKGSLRFDPELLSALNNTGIIFEERIKSILEETKNKKIKIQDTISNFINSEENSKYFIKLLQNYFNNISILSIQPLIVEADYEKIPVLILIKNGQWVLPGSELLKFIKQAKEQKRQPIVIAKKIHGILFPFFKNVSVLGVNLYSAFVNKEIIELAGSLKNEATLSDNYNERLDDLEEFANNIEDEYYEENLLKKFFEILIPKHIDDYYQNFLKQKIEISDFKNTVKKMKGVKARNGIMKWIEKRKQLLLELKYRLKRKDIILIPIL